MSSNDSNSKAPVPGTHTPNGRTNGAEQPLVKVQPPRREDLQPSYAQVIKPDTEDESQHGWYGCKWIHRTSPLPRADLTKQP